MGRRLLYCLLIAAVCLTSCKKKEQVIPRGKMAKIYAEMFIVDQRLAGQAQKVRSAADTSWVYEPIFEKYGYSSDDYRASQAYYIQDANRYARILRQSAAIIEGEIKALKKEKALMERMGEAGDMISVYEPERIFYMTGIDNPNVFGSDSLRIFLDSTGGRLMFDAREWADTAFYGPVVMPKGGYPEDVEEEGDEAEVEAEETLMLAPAEEFQAPVVSLPEAVPVEVVRPGSEPNAGGAPKPAGRPARGRQTGRAGGRAAANDTVSVVNGRNRQ